MSETLTIEKWQEQFKKKPTTGTPVVPTAKEADEFDVQKFDARLDRIIASAKRIAALEYKAEILLTLHVIDNACISAASEMLRLHACEEATARFNTGRDALKRLIYEIETKQEVSNGKKTNQLEA